MAPRGFSTTTAAAGFGADRAAVAADLAARGRDGVADARRRGSGALTTTGGNGLAPSCDAAEFDCCANAEFIETSADAAANAATRNPRK